MTDLRVLGMENVGDIKFTGIEGGFGKNKRAMLVKDIAQIHNQPLSEINRRINDNRSRFKDNIDIIDFLNGSEPFRKLQKTIILLVVICLFLYELFRHEIGLLFQEQIFVY